MKGVEWNIEKEILAEIGAARNHHPRLFSNIS
jgi:hypothetical protein